MHEGFGERLGVAMIAAGFGIRAEGVRRFAKACGVTPQTVRNWLGLESAAGVLSGHLHCAATALGVRMRWLYEGKGPVPISPMLDRLTDLAAALTDEQLEEWIAIGERMKA